MLNFDAYASRLMSYSAKSWRSPERLHHMCRLVGDVYHRSQSDDVTTSTKDCDDSMASWHLMKIVTMKEVRGGS